MAETSVRRASEAGRSGGRHAAKPPAAPAEGTAKRSAAGKAAAGKSAPKKSSARRAPAKERPGAARASGGKRARGKGKRRSVLQLLKESWFYRIYFGILALCAVGLAFGLVTLNGVMKEYEQTRPIHAAQDVFAQIESRDWSALREIDASATRMKFEGPEQYVQYMQELTNGGEFTLKSVLTIDESEQKYSVLMGGKKFAEFTLEHSGEKTEHNFEGWRLKSLETTAMASDAFTFTVPSDSTVEVNGVTLTAEDAVETGIAAVSADNLPEGTAAPTLTRYAVYMFTGQPDSIRVTDRNGSEQQLTQDGEREWSCGLPNDDDKIKAQYEEAVVKWGRRLAAYTSDDYDKFDLSNACIDPSPARTYIRNMENQWAAKHSGYDFENIQTGNYHIYSDDCFSCEISFDYILHYTQQDKTYPTKYTLYFARGGSTYKLYSFTMN